MNGMKIDLRTIRIWVAKWEKGTSVNQTASQLAAVMLSKALEQNEIRSVQITGLMKEILEESAALQKLERACVGGMIRKEALDTQMNAELKAHRRKMAAILREADLALKAPEQYQSITVGGLLLEINKRGWATEGSA
jgi:hypothetical protein